MENRLAAWPYATTTIKKKKMRTESLIILGLGITTVNVVCTWIRKQRNLKVINRAKNEVEAVIPPQTILPAKRTRTKVTSGMVRKWDIAAKKGMSHKQIAAKYGVALVSVDRHLARMSRKREPKTGRMPGTGTKATNYKP